MLDSTKYTSKLAGKSVLVIGGTSGIGFAVAEAATEYGAKVIISSSNADRVDAALKQLVSSYPSAKDRVSGFPCDISDEKTMEENLVKLLEFTGELDHIVFTAGPRIPPTPIAEATIEKLSSAATVRYTAAVMLAKHAPKHLRKTPDSSITFTTGIVTEKPIPGWSVIAGARSAVVGLGKALALDLRPVRVNVVSVGTVNTGTWSHLDEEAKSASFKAQSAKFTTGRVAEASDVAEAYLYCMKDTNVTGSVISSNGGALLM